ncbi:phospholipase D family protein [Pseudooceanicola aestuarii]|uniref:phospholipase D family protein n=1 Tax=Pseudooceanicola aestuarii TaxID=2697319 RepID=UPI0013D2D2AD|nr:phospholipase D family protein [Pseudooceanicola aestuarii]
MPRDVVTDQDLFRPLITASEMFPALERLVLGARSEVLMAFRIFDARASLRSAEARKLGLKTWADLLAHTAGRGVKLRLLMADFDPVFASDLHRAAWASARNFGHRLPDNAEILCALHECKSGALWRRIFWSKIKARIDELSRHDGAHLTPLQHQAVKGKVTLRPVSLHQKFAVADGDHAIIGGIDVDERRYDDADHDRPANETWHDISVEVTGAVAPDIRRHFADCWNRARRADAASFGGSLTGVDQTAPLRPASEKCLDPQLIRTISCHPGSALRLGASPQVTEHEAAHLDAIEGAERLIYIETQFFRHAPIARALARAAQRAPELQLILVMPTEPERVIFNGDDGIDVRHAQSLQLRCLDICRRAFGDRMAVLAPAQPRAAPDHTPLPLQGAEIIYLHSKVTLVDEAMGIIGSANLNGRSMRWDTEASLMFRDAAQIRALRNRLTRYWLRDHADDGDPTRAATWQRIAANAAMLSPERRSTFLLPWPERRNRRFARFLPILPPEMF